MKVLLEFLRQVKREIKYKIKRPIYEREIEKRSHLSIFDYKELSQDMELVTKEYGWNAYYNLDVIVKSIIGIPREQVLYGAIEHGILRYNEVAEVTLSQNVIFAFGYRRMKYLQERYPEKRVYSVGPYIQYVSGYLSDDKIKELKKEFGKTLVVFTSHSIPGEHVEFDVNSFIKEIERIKIEYDFRTVIVSLHWKDILTYKLDEPFCEMGYRICCSGHLYDTNFLRRLKSVIDLSDMVMANDTGSYLGYTTTLGKPFYLYYLKPESTFDEGVVNGETDYNELYYQEFISKAINAYGDYKEEVTDAQIEFVEEYWGKMQKGLETINCKKTF